MAQGRMATDVEAIRLMSDTIGRLKAERDRAVELLRSVWGDVQDPYGEGKLGHSTYSGLVEFIASLDKEEE